jgi:hypothetical protein
MTRLGFVNGATESCASEDSLNELVLAQGFREVILLLSVCGYEAGIYIHTSICAARHFSRSPTMA